MAHSQINLDTRVTRRRFLKTTAALGGVSLLGLDRAMAQRPNAVLNLASVGVGGKGWSDLQDSAAGTDVRIVALCDVDADNLARAAGAFPEARTFADYRAMLDRMGRDIDAVLVSTPDHMHGPIALAAMQLGKHVHVQKPLAHNLAELRAMRRAAVDNPRLVTQMGTQIHSHPAYRTAVATIRAGAIGKVSEAHLWVSKSWAGPPEGAPDRADPVPATLDWDIWLGVAPSRRYVSGLYHPANWRKWRDFGSGTLGDMGCHIYDPVFGCLNLAVPTSVVSRGPQTFDDAFAPDTDVRYRFAPTKYTTRDFTFRWTDGSAGSRPDASRAQLPEGVDLPGEGAFLVGERGVMVLPHYDFPRFYSMGRPLDVEVRRQDARNHYTEFTDACRGVGRTSTPFPYSALVTEAVLVGTVAACFKDRELRWNSDRLEFDHPPATALVRRTYRDGRNVLQ